MLPSTDLSLSGDQQTDWCSVQQTQVNSAATASLKNGKLTHFLDHHSSLTDSPNVTTTNCLLQRSFAGRQGQVALGSSSWDVADCDCKVDSDGLKVACSLSVDVGPTTHRRCCFVDGFPGHT